MRVLCRASSASIISNPSFVAGSQAGSGVLYVKVLAGTETDSRPAASVAVPRNEYTVFGARPLSEKLVPVTLPREVQLRPSLLNCSTLYERAPDDALHENVAVVGLSAVKTGLAGA